MLAVCLSLSAIATEITPFALYPPEVLPLEMYGSAHEYDSGLVDGGVYYLRNFA